MSGHNTGAVLEGRVTARGTSNGNLRGSSYSRRRRREWLVETYRADINVMRIVYADAWASAVEYPAGSDEAWMPVLHATIDPRATVETLPACRCYRCGRPLTVHTVTADRIIPGCRGGTYRRDNIRPACGDCNSVTGGGVRR